jgi:hypothetical protein
MTAFTIALRETPTYRLEVHSEKCSHVVESGTWPMPKGRVEFIAHVEAASPTEAATAFTARNEDLPVTRFAPCTKGTP